MRILFMGTPGFAVPSLTYLAERPDLCEVVGVVTQPDKPAGRGRKLTASAVKTVAMARGIPILQPTRMKAEETRQEFAALKPDLAVVAAYGRILPPALLEVPKLGCVNVHASILPRHRGASPIAHMILEGDSEVGVSIMAMEEGLDTGPVFGVASRPAKPTDTLGALTAELAEMGAKKLIELLPGIADGSVQPVPQVEAEATYAPLLQKPMGRLDFTLSAEELERRVRGLSPWPGTFTFLSEKRLGVGRVELDPEPTPEGATPGEAWRVDPTGVSVACGQGSVRLLRVQPEGKKPMDIAAWIAGRRISAGDILGDAQKTS